MTRTIRIDDDVYDGLKKLADPFEDTPNTVIRKLLVKADLITPEAAQQVINKKSQVKKTKRGLLTPQPVYEKWLLYTLWHKFQGRAHKADVTKATIEEMQKRKLLNEHDYKEVPSGGQIRAENTITWGRNKLKELGFIKVGSRIGIWELTEKGIDAAKKIIPPNDKNEY